MSDYKDNVTDMEHMSDVKDDTDDHDNMSSIKDNVNTNNKNVCRIIVGCIMPAIVLGITGVVLYYYFVNGGNTDALRNSTWFGDLGLFHAEDPFAELNGTYAWPNDGTGLELTLVNCLDSRWDVFFDQAVADWDHGTPDALTLSTTTGTIDSSCDPIDGVLKVCNGNYGETNWKGINQVLLDNNGRIYASAARLNEYFLSPNSDPNERQYTMCHEIGHGFGLKHTDERFYNLNQGNCLDYTTRPKSNMHPDERLWNILAEIYGTVDGSMLGTTAGSSIYNTGGGSSSSSSSSASSSTSSFNSAGPNGRHRSLLSSSLSSSKGSIPDFMKKATKDIDEYFTAEAHYHNRIRGRSLWSTPDYHHRILEQNHYVETHEFYIVEYGHIIQVHLLLA